MFLLLGIHRLKQSLPKRQLGKMTMYDPIFPVAMEIAAETCLLCLDEFQVRRGWAEEFEKVLRAQQPGVGGWRGSTGVANQELITQSQFVKSLAWK